MFDKVLKHLFPKDYRVFAYKRFVIALLRTIHIVCFSILVGGFFFQQDQSLLVPWFIGTMLSGMLMFLIDIYGSCIILFEVRGISILLKLLILFWMPLLSQNIQIALLMFLIVLSSYISHTTRNVRHKTFMPDSFMQKYGLK